MTHGEAAKALEKRLRDSMRNDPKRVRNVEVIRHWGGQVSAKVVLHKDRGRPPALLMQSVLNDALDLWDPSAISCYCGVNRSGRVFAKITLSKPCSGWKVERP